MKVQKGQKFVESNQLDWLDLGSGVRRKIAAYDEQVMAVYVEFKKGAVGALHKHPHRQITHIHAGSFEVNIAGEKKILHARDYFFVPPDIEHGVVALEDGLLVDTFVPMREDFLK